MNLKKWLDIPTFSCRFGLFIRTLLSFQEIVGLSIPLFVNLEILKSADWKFQEISQLVSEY